MDLFDSPWKIAIIAVLIIVLFGSRKLPGAARSLGQSMRILKKEMQGLHEDEPDMPATAQAAPAPAQAPATAQIQAAQAVQAVPATDPAPDAQVQIAALQEQLNSLQHKVGANGTAAADSQQTR
ncbi:MAG: Sec-independent protein translocase subunit TatA [Trebonia sp.]